MTLDPITNVEEKKYSTCGICGKNISSRSLSTHLKRHDLLIQAGKNYKCSHCERVFNDTICLKEHRDAEHPRMKKHECNICGKMFTQKCVLTKHCLSVHEEIKTKECWLCGEKFSRSDNLKKHLNSHKTLAFSEPKQCFYCALQLQDPMIFRKHVHEKHNENILITKLTETTNTYKYKCADCDYCGKFCEVEQHYQSKHTVGGQQEIFKCPYCPAEFFYWKECNDHSESHLDAAGNVHFSCQECSLTFETADEYALHYQEHYEKRPFPCGYCDRRFITANSCLQHQNARHAAELSTIRSEISDGLSLRESRNIELRGWQDMLVPGPERDEANELAYTCRHCGKKYYGTKGLQSHLDKYKEQRFACEFCDFRVNSISALRNHESTHKDDRNVLCKTCGQSFKTKSALKVHERVHAKKKQCKCQDCGEDFEDYYTYMVHVKKKHGGIYECSTCNLKFETPDVLTEHKRTSHPEKFRNECHICGEKFKHFFSLTVHLRLHESSEQQCKICGEKFQDEYNLSQHAKMEHDGKIYHCEKCGLVHRTLEGIRLHRRRVHGELPPLSHRNLSDGISVRERRILEIYGWLDMLTRDCERNTKNALAFICKYCNMKVYGTHRLRKHLSTHKESVSAEKPKGIKRLWKETVNYTSTGNYDQSNSEIDGEEITDKELENILNAQKEITSLPLSIMIYKEMVAKPDICCIVWTKSLEPDTANIVDINPRRCYIWVVEEDNSQAVLTKKMPKNLNKIVVSLKLRSDEELKIAVYRHPSNQLASHELKSLLKFEEFLNDFSKTTEIVHFMRHSNDVKNMVSRESKQRLIVCNEC